MSLWIVAVDEVVRTQVGVRLGTIEDVEVCDIIGRLRDEGTNILYMAAYLNRLREAAPSRSSWRSIYGTEFDPNVGSYNPDPKFVAGFVASSSYYSYLDYP